MAVKARVTKVNERFYKLELVTTAGLYSADVARALTRAITISGMPAVEFFRAILLQLGLTINEAQAFATGNGFISLEAAANACLSGEVIPCADVLLAAAVIAGTTVGILLEESSMAEQIRSLTRQVRALQRGELISMDASAS